ncbi:pilus assembly FimT family protein [Massilia pseudoviolaceinigra]|uniref:pilus assembly FimT family protein n=1 Tax=Massilia pseudoviolaceinigra TaxID=3057165 RepID=UPI00279695B6|nr:prepilin-type N-terminal cleavage/methylation domain-containing protein [Massilia sp. CCM 9206]MDQ1921144.1 prepilin-type N-terminal cleavage/methylation domain-containing protein [Massilia sp. CCM 9206]
MSGILRRHGKHLQQGFTLVELITVMVIVGVLAAAAATRYFDRAVYDAAAFTEQARSLVRYGQKVAVAQNRPVFVRLDGNSVALCFVYVADGSCPADQRVMSPSANNTASTNTLARCANSTSWACEGNPPGVTYATSPATAFFSYDALGRPANVGADAFARLTMTVKSGASSVARVVEADTGHVH